MEDSEKKENAEIKAKQETSAEEAAAENEKTVMKDGIAEPDRWNMPAYEVPFAKRYWFVIVPAVLAGLMLAFAYQFSVITAQPFGDALLKSTDLYLLIGMLIALICLLAGNSSNAPKRGQLWIYFVVQAAVFAGTFSASLMRF